MAGFTWIFVVVFIVSCSAHLGYDHSNDYLPRSSLKRRQNAQLSQNRENLQMPQNRPYLQMPQNQQNRQMPQNRQYMQMPQNRQYMQMPQNRQDMQMPQNRQYMQMPQNRQDMQMPQNRQSMQQIQSQQNFQKRPQPKVVTDKKCFTLARRPFYMTRLIRYPCSRRMNGVPVFRSYMSPMGPMCMSYFRERVHKFYRIPVCCPGYAMDRMGKCSIRVGDNRKMRPQQTQRPDYQKMMSMAAALRKRMWMRANEAMERKRQAYFSRMRQASQMMPPRRPSFSSLLDMYAMKRRQQPSPKITFIRFKKPSTLPMPHPVQRPPLNNRMISILRSTAFPQKRITFQPRMRFPQIPRPFQRMPYREPPTPRFVLANRARMLSFRRMHPFHPPMSNEARMNTPDVQIIPKKQDNFPSIPKRDPYSGHYDDYSLPQKQSPYMQPNEDFGPPDTHDKDFHIHADEGFQPEKTQESLQVTLPDEPVKMPEPVVEQTPDVDAAVEESCIAMMETGVKACLKKYKVDVANGPLMTAFEPINDDMSRVLCETEEAIFQCISDSLNDCKDQVNAEVARDMLNDTAATVKDMCELRAASVVQTTEPELLTESTTEPTPEEQFIQPDPVVPVETAPSSANTETDTNVSSADTAATVENVDAIPTDVKPPPPPAQEEVIAIVEEEKPSEMMRQAIKNEVHVQELRMQEYYLPILIGSGVGFVILVLVIALLICCCCRRKLRKKMRMVKELEKPPLKDGIYTIGVAPPTYEVNGIPPLYYEEAKGEKITSRSPAVLQGSEDESQDGDHTQM